MKKIFLLAVASLLFLSSCYEQKFTKTAFEWSGTIDVPGSTKAQLYQRGVEWFNESFKNMKAVMQSQDKESGSFYGKGAIEDGDNKGTRTNWILFSVNIAVKDGKYKYVLTDFRHEGTTWYNKHTSETNGGKLENDMPDRTYPKIPYAYWNETRDYAREQADALIAALKKKMSDKSLPETF